MQNQIKLSNFLNLIVINYYSKAFNDYNLYAQKETNQFFKDNELNLELKDFVGYTLTSYENKYNEIKDFVLETLKRHNISFDFSDENFAFDQLNEFYEKPDLNISLDIEKDTYDKLRQLFVSALVRKGERWTLSVPPKHILEVLSEKQGLEYKLFLKTISGKKVTGSAEYSRRELVHYFDILDEEWYKIQPTD